jgi:hypothetical protein
MISNDFTPRLRPAALPVNPKVRLRDGRWVRARAFGWLIILGDTNDLAKKGVMPCN